MTGKKVLVTGAAGFIGSYLIEALIKQGAQVYGIDNLSRGRENNLTTFLEEKKLEFLVGDISERKTWEKTVPEKWPGVQFDAIFHMAANSDISAGIANPDIDLKDTFLTTHESLLFARSNKVKHYLFASSSAIYGEHDGALKETTGPCLPISFYGAMKLASEGLISAAGESFLEKCWIFRFPNVVGGKATHGIMYDLVGKIDKDPKAFSVFGDGEQRKPYLHAAELVDAMLFCYANSKEKVSCYNIGVNENNSSVKFIAETVRDLYAPNAQINYTGGSKGWSGDVAKVVFSTEKINRLGWKPKLSSDEAVVKSVKEIIEDKRNGIY